LPQRRPLAAQAEITLGFPTATTSHRTNLWSGAKQNVDPRDAWRSAQGALETAAADAIERASANVEDMRSMLCSMLVYCVDERAEDFDADEYGALRQEIAEERSRLPR
jgi:hypothetical protein